jgi:hypothetical protein
MGTSNVSASRSGTTFNIDVTACNLLPDLTIKDFRIFYDGTFFCEGTACTEYTKTTATNLQYNGVNLPTTSVQVRRKTPNNVVQVISYANRISSAQWNAEFDRNIRWREEADLNGTGFSSVTTVATPINDPFGVIWSGNVINPVTANSLYNKFITMAPLASPVFTGDPTAPTPATADNDTSIATTAYVKNNLSSYAPLASPALTGNPSATTQSANTNNTTIATTAFVHQELKNALDGTSTIDQIITGVYKNVIINGRFDIWQRNITFAYTTDGASAYSADRWRYDQSRGGTGTVGNVTITRESHVLGQSGVENNAHPNFFLRMTINTAPSGTGATSFHRLRTEIEGVHLLSGQVCTLSFLTRSSISSKVIGYRIQQNFGTGGSPSTPVEVTSGTVTVASTSLFNKHSITFTMPSVAGKVRGSDATSDRLVVFFYIQSGSSEIPPSVPIGGTGTVDISSVQLERGAYATSFEQRTFAIELLNCSRYFRKSYAHGTYAGTATTSGIIDLSVSAAGTGAMFLSVVYPVPMRTTPTVTLYDDAGTINMVFKGASGKAATVNRNSNSGFAGGTVDATSADRLLFHFTSDADY